MKSRLKSIILGTPAEPVARWFWKYVRRADRLEPPLLQEDQWTFEILRRVLREDSNCVDVGCAQGQILSEMVRLSPRGVHHAFEPIPHSARALRSAFPSVQIHEIALSDQDGESSFQHVVSNPAYSGLRQRQYPRENETIETLQVRVRRLDAVIPVEQPVDFIKIDVEGAELQVLRGAERTIRTFRPHIVFEHGKGAAEFYGTRSELVYDFLVETCGLRISLLPEWLRGASPLERDDFTAMFGGEHWYFLAHP